MHYEIWDIVSGNRIAAVTTQEEALDLVRSLLGDGRDANRLTMGAFPNKGRSAAAFPVALQGAALKELVLGVPA